MAFFSFIAGVVISNVSIVWYRTVLMGQCGIDFSCEDEQIFAVVIELFKSIIDIGIMLLIYYSLELGKGYPKIKIPFIIVFFLGALVGVVQFLLFYMVNISPWWELLTWILSSAIIGLTICLWTGKITSSFNEAINSN